MIYITDFGFLDSYLQHYTQRLHKYMFRYNCLNFCVCHPVFCNEFTFIR